MPIENLTVEFPFELPPKAGPVALRRRAADSVLLRVSLITTVIRYCPVFY
jgi:hypothetical protein